MKKPVFTGAAVAIITPFKSTGEVDYEEFGKIIDHQIAHGTDAIVVCGTTGEASALHDKEHREALAWCCEYVNHRVPVVAGTGSNDTAYAIELTKFAAECGADAGLSVTPYYNKTTQRGLIAHYTAIADCCDLPIVLYNVPSRTGVSFTADTLYELSKHPNINGLKAASGNFSLLAETMAKCGDNLNRETLKDAIQSYKGFDGLMGPFEFTEDGAVYRGYKVVQYQDGVLTSVSDYMMVHD